MKVRNDIPAVDPKSLETGRTGTPKAKPRAKAEAPRTDTVAVASSSTGRAAVLERKLASGGPPVRDPEASDTLTQTIQASLQTQTGSPFDLQGVDPRAAALALLG